MERRLFFTAAAAASAPLLGGAQSPAKPPGGALTDTNVYLSHWANRHSWINQSGTLAERLRRHGVTSAWVASFDGVLHSDLAGVNARLTEACATEAGGLLRPIGTVNPTLPDWEDDLRRCHEVHRMAGIRLFPNYHGYALEDPRFARLLEVASKRGLLVQIVISIEDERSQNPVLTASPVQAAPLAELLPKFSAARVMLLNSGARILTANLPLLHRLVAAGVWFEIAALEGVAGIENLYQKTPAIRLCFGSHTPYFYIESALLKLQESDLSTPQVDAIRFGHAQAALSPA